MKPISAVFAVCPLLRRSGCSLAGSEIAAKEVNSGYGFRPRRPRDYRTADKRNGVEWSDAGDRSREPHGRRRKPARACGAEPERPDFRKPMPAPDPQQHSSSAQQRRRQRTRGSRYWSCLPGIAVFVADRQGLYFRAATGNPSHGGRPPEQRRPEARFRCWPYLHPAANPIRLAPIPTDGPIESFRAAGHVQDRPGGGARRSDMPADAQSVAILRKNVVVLWSPSGLPVKGSKKARRPKSSLTISRDTASP